MQMLQYILDYPDIYILLNTDFKVFERYPRLWALYYSGSIDEYYDYDFGKIAKEIPERLVTFLIWFRPIKDKSVYLLIKKN